jgi:hypothetical protein
MVAVRLTSLKGMQTAVAVHPEVEVIVRLGGCGKSPIRILR